MSGSPVSPLKPWSRLSPSDPSIHTIGSAPLSFDVVTIGAPAPWTAPHHAFEMLGSGVPRTLSTVSPPFPALPGHEVPPPAKATSAPSPDENAAGEVRMGLDETFS